MRNFDEAYKRIYKKYNKYLEKLRIKAYITTIIIAIALFIIYIWIFEELMFTQKYFMITSILIICFCIYKILIKGKNTKVFKYGVINDFVKEYDEGLQYIPDGAISKITYNSAYFGSIYDAFFAEDLVRGIIKEGVNLEFGEIKLYKDIKTEQIGKIERQKIFEGIFAKIKLNSNFYSVSKIKIRNNRLIDFSAEKQNKIELESFEFEKYFDFYAEDKIEALKIFTIDVIEKINYFREKYNINFEITIYKNEIYIRFPKKDFFEIKLGKNTLDYKMLQEYYKIIEMIGDMAIYFNDILKQKKLI